MAYVPVCVCVRACGTPSNREARRLDDELRAVEQSMKSQSPSAMQVLQAKGTLWVPSLSHAAESLPCFAVLIPLLFNVLSFWRLDSFLPLTWQTLCKNNSSHAYEIRCILYAEAGLLRYWGFPFHLNICNSYYFFLFSLSLSVPFWIFLYFLLCLSILTSLFTPLPLLLFSFSSATFPLLS